MTTVASLLHELLIAAGWQLNPMTCCWVKSGHEPIPIQYVFEKAVRMEVGLSGR